MRGGLAPKRPFAGAAASSASPGAIVTAGLAALAAARWMAVGEFVSMSSQRDLELADLRTQRRSSRQVLQANSMNSPRSTDHVVSIVRWLDAWPGSSVPEIRSGHPQPENLPCCSPAQLQCLGSPCERTRDAWFTGVWANRRELT